MNTENANGFWQCHVDKLGAVGSIIAGLCCLGAPAILSVVSALGLGFIINDAVLVPVLVVFLGLTLYGLWNGWRRHGRRAALVVGIVSAAGFLGVLRVNRYLAVAAMVALIGATILNIWFGRAQRVRTARQR